MAIKKVYGIFEDDDVVVEAVKTLRAKKFNVVDVISPFPIHGLDLALGLKRTRLSICTFLYGITGTSMALLMMWYMNIWDWPLDIGGKPSFALYKNMPAFIPVTFEITVLFAAHGMVLTFLLRSKLLPGVEPNVIDNRMADDRFVMTIEASNAAEVEDAKEAMTKMGALYTK